MVYFEEDYSTMYNRTSYTPTGSSPAVYNASPTIPTVSANYLTSSSSYPSSMLPADASVSSAYYDTNNYRMYWSHKEETTGSYSPGTGSTCWTPAAACGGGDIYTDTYKTDSYYGCGQPAGLSGHQMGQQYPACAMMTSQQMAAQAALDEEMAKERQHGYGWITPSSANNCKLYLCQICVYA